MFLFGKKPGPTIGLDINSSTISVIQLEKTKTDVKVARFSSMPTPPDIVREGLLSDPEAVGSAVRELLDMVGIPNKKPIPVVNLAIPGQAVVIRLMPVPTGMPPEELADVVRQEAINNLPFPVDEANIDFSLLPSTERTDPDGVKRVDVILAAIQRIVVDSYWRMAETANVTLGRLDISSLSVIRAMTYSGVLKDDSSMSMAVNIRNDATDITLVKKGMPLFSRSVLLGVETLGEAISRSIDVPIDEAISLLPKIQLGSVPTSDPKLGQAAQVARSVFGDLTAEVGRSLEFYMSQVGMVQVDQTILTGSGCVVPGIADFMSNRLNIDTTIADPFNNLIYDTAQIIEERRPAYSMLVGLVVDPKLAAMPTVEVDLNKEGPPERAATEAAEEEGEEGVAEPDTPWFIPVTIFGAVALLISVGVWAYFSFFMVSSKEAELLDLEAKITTSKKDVEQLAEKQAEVQSLRDKESVLARIVNHGMPRASILQMVRDNVPQGVAVRALDMRGSNIQIYCYTIDFAKASHYAINLAGSNLLEDTHIQNVHRLKERPEIVVFEIAARLTPEGEGAILDSKPEPAAEQPQSVSDASTVGDTGNTR